MNDYVKKTSRRAFLKRPENFSGLFSGAFFGFRKAFLKAPELLPKFSGMFSGNETQGIARGSISQPVIGSKIAIDIAALCWVRHCTHQIEDFFVESPAVARKVLSLAICTVPATFSF